MSAHHIVELNGKKYDAATGRIIHTPSPKRTIAAPSKTAKRAAHTAGSLDGVTATKTTPLKRPKPQSARATNHTTRAAQKSHTLMRKPARAKHVQAVTTPVVDQETPQEVPTQPVSRLSLDKNRFKRAQAIPKNRYIGRFEAKTPPASRTAQHAAPVSLPPAQPVLTPQPENNTMLLPATNTQPAEQPSHLEQAIAAATSHHQPKHHTSKPKAHHRVARKLRVKPKTVSLAAASLIVLGILGIVTYQQFPRMQARLASSRAGISSSLPAYVPSGYSLSRNIDYDDGQVTFNFESRADDDRAFTITQTKSFWTSEALRENFIDTLDSGYQTVQEKGKTIYLYDDGAAWVDGGIWYRIEADDAGLSSTQLSDIINSL